MSDEKGTAGLLARIQELHEENATLRAELTDANRKGEMLCSQNGNLLIQEHDLKRELSASKAKADALDALEAWLLAGEDGEHRHAELDGDGIDLWTQHPLDAITPAGSCDDGPSFADVIQRALSQARGAAGAGDQ